MIIFSWLQNLKIFYGDCFIAPTLKDASTGQF